MLILLSSKTKKLTNIHVWEVSFRKIYYYFILIKFSLSKYFSVRLFLDAFVNNKWATAPWRLLQQQQLEQVNW